MYTGFVYVWYDRAEKRMCVGSHMGTVDDGYVSCTGDIWKEYRKRPSHFMRRIVYWHTTDDVRALREQEQIWLNQIPDQELGRKFYNLSKRHSTVGWPKGLKRPPITAGHREKLSKARRSWKMERGHYEMMSGVMSRKRWWTDGTVSKRSETSPGPNWYEGRRKGPKYGNQHTKGSF